MTESLLEITITDKAIKEVVGRLEYFETDQLPFALSGSLYGVAVDAREKMRKQLPKVFTIRQPKPWALRALTFDPKNKKKLRDAIKAGGEPSISIYSKDEVLGPLLTDGGIRKPYDGKELGVPIIGGGRKTLPSKLTRKTGAQGVLKNNPRAMVITSADGRRLMVLRPMKYKRGVPKREQHKAMFHMRKFVSIKPWWNARKILLAEMNQQLPTRFEEQCRIAMETRK